MSGISSGVHIYAPPVANWEQKRRRCPTCERRTQHLGEFYEWHGWTITCLSCGDIWTDGEMHERPFAPAWRKRNIESAKKRRDRYKARGK